MPATPYLNIDNIIGASRKINIKIKYAKSDTRRLEILPNGDWIDLSVDEDISMNQWEYKLISLGVAMVLPKDHEAHIIPRSSTFKKYGIIQANHMGLIDNSYCGDSDWWMFPAFATENVIIPRHTRICQFRIVEKQPLLELQEVESFGTKDRGGFGSTGN